MTAEMRKQVENYLAQSSKIAPAQLKQITDNLESLLQTLRPATK